MRHRSLETVSRGSPCSEESSRSTTSGIGVSAGGGTRYLSVPPSSGNNRCRKKPLPKLRGLGCAGSWCKPQVLSPEQSGPSVPAMAAEMLQKGWVTREEYAQLLMGDRLYCMHEAAEAQEGELQASPLVSASASSSVDNSERVRSSTSSKKSRPGLMRGVSRRKSGKCAKTLGVVHSSKAAMSTPEKKKKVTDQHPADKCRDPITLDDLGSWTWDFHASEAATPPVSCGGTVAPKNSVELAKRGGECHTWGKKRSKGRSSEVKGKSRVGGGDGGITSSSPVVTYNVESLVLYLLESGDFQEPTTRRPFSLVQLADLDALAAKAGAKVKGSLVKSYQEGQAKYRERRERREMLVGADRCLGDVVSEMLSTIEDSDEPHDEAHVYLVTLFPQFSHIFSELKEADEEFARQCLDQYKGTLRGPPNHPTQEQGGLLRTALEFLGEQGGGVPDTVADVSDEHTVDAHVEGVDGSMIVAGLATVEADPEEPEDQAAGSGSVGGIDGDTASEDGSMSAYSAYSA